MQGEARRIFASASAVFVDSEQGRGCRHLAVDALSTDTEVESVHLASLALAQRVPCKIVFVWVVPNWLLLKMKEERASRLEQFVVNNGATIDFCKQLRRRRGLSEARVCR